MLPHNPDQTILAAKRLVESNKRSEIRLNANGGNSILIVCEPGEESDYVKAIYNHLPGENFEVIDLNTLLVEFVANNKEELESSFELLKGSIHQIFKTPDGEEGNDLFGLIIRTIQKCLDAKKIPVLIHSGALYGSGIDNIHLMEHDIIMKASVPLLILYPATRDGDKLLFLSKRPASRYRCMIVD